MNKVLNKTIRKMFLKNKFKFLGIMTMVIITTSMFFYLIGTANYHSSVQNYLNDKHNMESGVISLNNQNFENESKVQELFKNFNNLYKNKQTSNLISQKTIDNLTRMYKNDYNEEKKVSDVTNITTDNQSISKYYLDNGVYDISSNNVVVTSSFLKLRNYKLNQVIKLNNKEFVIKGVVKTPSNTTNFGEVSNNYVIMSKENYDKFNFKEEYKILFKFKNNLNQQELDKFRNEVLENSIFKVKTNNIQTNLINSVLYKNENPSTSSFKIINFTNLEAYIVMIVFGLISLIMFVIITTKIIDSFSQEIGILKALGYTKNQIKKNFLTYSLIVVVFSTILGTIIGWQNVASNLVLSISKLDYPKNVSLINFDVISIIVGIILPIVLLFISINISISKLLNQDTLTLISGLKQNSKLLKFDFEKWPVKKALRYKILLSSPSRALALFIGTFFGAILITYMVSTLYSNIMGAKESTISVDAKSLVSDSFNIYERKTNKDNEIYSFNYNIVDVLRNKQNVKDAKLLTNQVPYPINIMALEKDFDKFTIKKEEVKYLDDGVILPDGFKRKYKVEVGDYIIFNNPLYPQKTFKLKINKFNNNESDFITFTSRKAFENATGYKNKYNAIIAKDSNEEKLLPNTPTKSVSSFASLKGLPFAIIGFLAPSVIIMSILVFLFILPIVKISTSFVIDENKKNIAVLRALGYTNKEVTSMMLNVYTMIVLGAIIISSIVLYILTPIIFDQLASNGVPSTYVTKWDIVPCLIGGLIIFLIYIITINISKKRLKKLAITKLLTL